MTEEEERSAFLGLKTWQQGSSNSPDRRERRADFSCKRPEQDRKVDLLYSRSLRSSPKLQRFAVGGGRSADLPPKSVSLRSLSDRKASPVTIGRAAAEVLTSSHHKSKIHEAPPDSSSGHWKYSMEVRRSSDEFEVLGRLPKNARKITGIECLDLLSSPSIMQNVRVEVESSVGSVELSPKESLTQLPPERFPRPTLARKPSNQNASPASTCAQMKTKGSDSDEDDDDDDDGAGGDGYDCATSSSSSAVKDERLKKKKRGEARSPDEILV